MLLSPGPERIVRKRYLYTLSGLQVLGLPCTIVIVQVLDIFKTNPFVLGEDIDPL
jgi:hypothetical protein